MNRYIHRGRKTYIQIFWIIGLVGVLACCNVIPTAIVQTTNVVPTDTPTMEPSPILVTDTALPAVTEKSITATQYVTATPYVWIDAGTNVARTGTLYNYPTFTPTSTPTVSLTPSLGPSSTVTKTLEPSPTITSTSNPPNSPLSIIKPGLASRIISPYDIEANIARGEDKKVYLSLIGENEQIFCSETLDYSQSSYSWLKITPTLNFTFTDVAENARLILQTVDSRHRVMALSSVDLILLSIGKNEINPAQHAYAPFVIDSPDEGDEISGKKMIVSGRIAALNDNPVIIELLDEDGNVLVKRELIADPPAAGETYTPFIIEMTVDVPKPVQARLSIRQESDTDIPGTIALSSVAVTLLP